MKINNEAKVGLMVTLSFTIFVVLIAMLAKFNMSHSGYKLRVYCSYLNGLSANAPVKIAGGIKIGYVTDIMQSAENTEVVIWIDKKYNLLKTAKFAIFTTGLIGEKYVNVFIPSSSSVTEFFSDGDIVYGIDPANFDQMMLIFQSFMQDDSGGEMLAQIFQNSRNFIANLNKLTEDNKSDIRQTVIAAKSMITLLNERTNTLTAQLNKITADMAYISEKNKEEITISLRNLSELTQNLNKIVFRLEKGRGTLGKLLVEEEIYDNFRDASISAKLLFEELKKDPSRLLFKQK
jgi:phospholipid/cholesterol/gamma-HCH transport system substrate-binding protein